MRVMRLPEVEQKTGLRKSAIYDAIGKGTFPAPISLGCSARGWIESEVDDWISKRIAARNEYGTKWRHSSSRYGIDNANQ